MGTIYSLTDLTGRGRNAERRVVFMRTEIRRAPFIISIATTIVTLPLVAALVPMIGPYVLIVPIVVAGAAVTAFTVRQRRHMQVTHFTAFRNSMRARGRWIGSQTRDLKGVFLISGQRFVEPQFVLSTQPLVWTGKEGSGIDVFQIDGGSSR